LMSQGANLNAKDNKGRTPVDWATAYGKAEIVRILGGNITLPNPGLEFRILPMPNNNSALSNSIQKSLILVHKSLLDQKGPPAVLDGFGWFQTDVPDEFRSYVWHQHAGKTYVLAYTSPPHVLLRGDWKVIWASAGSDAMQRPILQFKLDTKGAQLLGPLSLTHKGQQLGVFVDNRLVFAASLQGEIRDRAEISGNFTAQQIDQMLKRITTNDVTSRPASSEPVLP
jgi:SecDF, P1 head subdomain